MIARSPWWQRVGVALDESLNVLLFDGDPHQTISLHAALARRDGARWACVLCRALGVLVQRHHCADQLVPEPVPTSAALRAGVLLFGTAAMLAWAARALLHAVL